MTSGPAVDDEPDEPDGAGDPLAVLRNDGAPDPLDLRAVLDWARPRGRAIVAGLAAVALVLVGVVLLRGRGAPPPDLSLPTLPSVTTATDAGAVSATTSTSTPSVVVAHAAGAVTAPGVYRLDAGSRIGDLLAAAGGLTTDADADRLNLAGPLADGQRVYVPRRGELEIPDVVAGGEVPAGDAGGSPADVPPGSPPSDAERVDVNRATLEQLDTLPGVGPATAQAIIDHREQHGPFTSVDGLLDVRGIGEAKLEQLRPLVSV